MLESGGELLDYCCFSISQTNVYSNGTSLRYGWLRQFRGSLIYGLAGHVLLIQSTLMNALGLLIAGDYFSDMLLPYY